YFCDSPFGQAGGREYIVASCNEGKQTLLSEDYFLERRRKLSFLLQPEFLSCSDAGVFIKPVPFAKHLKLDALLLRNIMQRLSMVDNAESLLAGALLWFDINLLSFSGH